MGIGIIFIIIVLIVIVISSKSNKKSNNIEEALPIFDTAEAIISFYTELLKDMGYGYKVERTDQYTTLVILVDLDNGFGSLDIIVKDTLKIIAISYFHFDYNLNYVEAIEILNKAKQHATIGDFTLHPDDKFIYEFTTVYNNSSYTLKEIFDIFMCHTEVCAKFPELVEKYLAQNK